MNDSTQRAIVGSEEQASLYVLNLLDAHDQQLFEAQLRRDADLRGVVRGLQAVLETEVFDDPAPPAPARIWGKILERTRMDGAQVLAFPKPMFRRVQHLSALAASLTLGAILHSWWLTVRHPSMTVAGLDSQSGRGGSVASASGAPGVGGNQEVSLMASTASKSGLGSGNVSEGSSSSIAAVGIGHGAGLDAPPTDSEHPLEAVNAALQGKVRALNAQLAELTQSLNQATVIPSGVSRIHVFSLGQQEPPTGIPSNLMDGSARTNSLTEALARMAGERMAVALNTAPSSALTMDGATRFGSPNVASTSGQGGVDSVGKVALVPAQPVPVEVSTSGLPNLMTSLASDPILASRSLARSASAGLTPIVFSAPDTGLYAVAVPSAPPTGQYQLWSRASDGTVSSLGVLTPSSSPVSVVTFERSSAEGLFMSLEPIGGSFQPSGPLVGAQNPVLPGLGRP